MLRDKAEDTQKAADKADAVLHKAEAAHAAAQKDVATTKAQVIAGKMPAAPKGTEEAAAVKPAPA